MSKQCAMSKQWASNEQWQAMSNESCQKQSHNFSTAETFRGCVNKIELFADVQYRGIDANNSRTILTSILFIICKTCTSGAVLFVQHWFMQAAISFIKSTLLGIVNIITIAITYTTQNSSKIPTIRIFQSQDWLCSTIISIITTISMIKLEVTNAISNATFIKKFAKFTAIKKRSILMP